jgi:hypothetical protein
MSQREVMIVVAHAYGCSMCRDRLLADPDSIFRGRSLTPQEKEQLAQLKSGDFVTAELLARATGSTAEEINTYRDHPVARLRHF